MAGAGVVLLKPLQFQIVQLAWVVQLFWSFCELRRPLLAWADQADAEAAGVAPVDAVASTSTSAAVAAMHASFYLLDMIHPFDIHHQMLLSHPPEDVWQCITTAAGNLGWLFPIEIEPWGWRLGQSWTRCGGAVAATR